MDEETSLWDVDDDLARDRIAARRRRIAKRLEMSAKLSAGLDELLKAEERRSAAAAGEDSVASSSPATSTAGTSSAAVGAQGGKDAAAAAAIVVAVDDDEGPEIKGGDVKAQCRASRTLLTEALENGGELVSNVRLAVDNLGKQHRQSVKVRNAALEMLLAREKEETKKEVELIDKHWPRADARRVIPTELFAQIHDQRASCNALLEKKNELIATLEEEIRDSNDQFKTLIAQYR